MSARNFRLGPFTFEPSPRGLRRNGVAARSWTLGYGSESLATRTLPAGFSQREIRDAFASDIGNFVVQAKANHKPMRINLVDTETDTVIGCFFSYSMCGMTPGLIDERSRYWLQSPDRSYSRDVTLSEFAELAARYAAPENGWIAGLLPDEVLTTDPEIWRPPSSWEIRHVVGEGSFTGISGASAAKLVGVTPQNFRKYTAADTAKTRQKMSFAMWHHLLNRLQITR